MLNSRRADDSRLVREKSRTCDLQSKDDLRLHGGRPVPQHSKRNDKTRQRPSSPYQIALPCRSTKVLALINVRMLQCCYIGQRPGSAFKETDVLCNIFSSRETWFLKYWMNWNILIQVNREDLVRWLNDRLNLIQLQWLIEFGENKRYACRQRLKSFLSLSPRRWCCIGKLSSWP